MGHPSVRVQIMEKKNYATPSKIFVILGKERLKYSQTMTDQLMTISSRFTVRPLHISTHILNQPPPGVYSNVVNKEVSVFSQDDPYKIFTILPIAH